MKHFWIVAHMAFVVMSCGKKLDTHTVTEQTLNEAVYASGEIMPLEYHFLKSATPQNILKILVKEGDSVKQGDLLAILGTESDAKQMEILNRQVGLAQQNAAENSAVLNELKMKIKLAKEKYEQDKLTYEKYKDLLKDKAVSQQQAENARLQMESSFTEYKSAEQRYNAQKNELNSRLLTAENQLAALKSSREGKVLTSPINGKVYNLNYEEGELVQPNDPVMMVGLEGNYKLELLIDERDISKVKIGQKVFFETDAYAGKQFEAKVSKIVPVLQKDTRSFKVEARVSSTENFYPQSSVEANIIIREGAKSLVIPATYLLPGDSVQLQNGENLQKIKIQTGARSGNNVEVKSGLKTGDIIAKNQ